MYYKADRSTKTAMELKRIKIYSGMAYILFLGIVTVIGGIAMFIVPLIAWESEGFFMTALWALICLAVVAVGVNYILVGYQTATLDENGIRLHTALWEIVFISWGDIVKVDVQDLGTDVTRAGKHPFKWIVIKTNFHQEAEDGNPNLRDKPPWKIKYTKRNAEIIEEYLERFSSIIPEFDYAIPHIVSICCTTAVKQYEDMLPRKSLKR